jgi:NAD(P)-dependent dehydrogenase (short-subunit alcohol dehydrogenase family)
MELKGKVALITGASSGIGEVIAKMYMEEGAKVFGCGRREKPSLEEGENFGYAAGDLTNFDDAKAIVDKCIQRYGKIDILVNCAGVTGIGTLETTSVEEFERQFKINVFGVFNICKAAIEELKRSEDAVIVNISSEIGEKPMAARIAYSPSKAAVSMLTKCLALDYGPKIRVNAILPGLVETPMTKERFDQAEDPEAYRQAIRDRYLLKRICTPEDVAQAAVFLASKQSSFITGASLPVCGGNQL